MIRELGRSIGTTVMETVGRAASRVQERRPLPVDLLESDDAYLAVFDAPGATSSDVQVRFDDNAVVVRIDRFRDFYEGFEMLVPGRGLSLDGRVSLPADTVVDPDDADATLRRNGTLEVRVPKDGRAAPSTAGEETPVDEESPSDPGDATVPTTDADADE
ncbi:Hsp20/alpha crystallin family protein [Halorientalis halophila]|uniref:Hsp20/alpha crystallin family protein n=1 Tax=Halorientalis halophila TaxID=3108499 RepID=UPI00300B488F